MKYLSLAVISLSLAATPALAQRDSVKRTPRATEFEVVAERLAERLSRARQTRLILSRELQKLDLSARNASTETRVAQLAAARDELETRIRASTAEYDSLRRQLTTLCSGERKPRGWVGFVISGFYTVSRENDGPEVLRFGQYPSVESVEPGSPAEKGGLMTGDVLLTMGGRDVRDGEFDFTSMLKPGSRLPFKIKRGMETKSVNLVIGRRPEGFEVTCPWIDERFSVAFPGEPREYVMVLRDSTGETRGQITRTLPRGSQGAGYGRPPRMPRGPEGTPPAPPVPSEASAPVVVPMPPGMSLLGTVYGSGTMTVAGADLVAMDRDLRDALGVSRGVLVLKVLRGSPAQEAGLRGGDVIIGVGGRSLTSPLGLQRALGNAESNQMRLQVVRKKKTQTIVLSWQP